MKEKILFWESLFVISSIQTKCYRLNDSNQSTWIRCESYSRSRMKTLDWSQWRCSRTFTFNCDHISNIALIVGFEQARVCCVYIDKTNTFENKNVMGYYCSILSAHKIYDHVNPSQTYPWIREKLLRKSFLQTLILAKTIQVTFKITCSTFTFL